MSELNVVSGFYTNVHRYGRTQVKVCDVTLDSEVSSVLLYSKCHTYGKCNYGNGNPDFLMQFAP